MKRIVILSMVLAVPLLGNGQAQKTRPATSNPPIPTNPSYPILPSNERRPSAVPTDSKRPTDRQVDSVYKNVYHMEVPVFYESSHTILLPPRK